MVGMSAGQLIFMIPIIAIGGGILAGIITSISKDARKRATAREREQTRREIAAYVAEGSMTPEEGERLLRAGGPEN